jgi:hypothetical protein
LKDNFRKRRYIIDKFNTKTTFLNSCVFVKEILYIGTEGVVSFGMLLCIPFDGVKATSSDWFEDCKASLKMLAVPDPTTPILT